MAKVLVADACLWLRHISDPFFSAVLASIHPGSRVTLTVDGIPVDFERMATGNNPQPTMGFKPVGESKTHWQWLYETQKGHDVDIEFRGYAD